MSNSPCIPLLPDRVRSRQGPKPQMHRNNPQMIKLVLYQCGINRTVQIHHSCVIICHIQLHNCVFLQQSRAADVHWQYFSFVFGIPQSSRELTAAVQIRFMTSIEEWHRCLSAQPHCNVCVLDCLFGFGQTVNIPISFRVTLLATYNSNKIQSIWS